MIWQNPSMFILHTNPFNYKQLNSKSNYTYSLRQLRLSLNQEVHSVCTCRVFPALIPSISVQAKGRKRVRKVN